MRPGGGLPGPAEGSAGPSRPGSVQVDQPLIGAAPKPQRDVAQRVHVPAVHQHVQQGKQFVGHRAAGMAAGRVQFLPGEAGKAPDVLLGQGGAYPAQEREQRALVFRLEGLSPQQGQAADIAGREERKQVRLGRFSERLAVGKIPGLGLKAVLTVVGTPGDGGAPFADARSQLYQRSDTAGGRAF